MFLIRKLTLGHELTHVGQQTASKDTRIQKAELRSPVFEETVSQISTIESFMHGRPLEPKEEEIARSIFGTNIDYTRVRLIPSPLLEYRVVANTIRVPVNFTILDAGMAQTFIHEMAHVWQYQHGGTKYMSGSLFDQISKGRNTAYIYTIIPGKSFFDYRVEQQAAIVTTYFGLLNLKKNPERYKPVHVLHFHNSKYKEQTDILPEKEKIEFELSLHEPLIQQMKAALPLPEIELLKERAVDVMQPPARENVPPVNQLVPLKPLFELKF